MINLCPNLHEDCIRILQKQIAAYDLILNTTDDLSSDVEEKLYEKQTALRNELNRLLGHCKELK